MHRKLTSNMPIDIDSLFVIVDPSRIRTRRRQHFLEPFTEKAYRTRTSTWIGPRLWNSIMPQIYSLNDVRGLTKLNLKKMTKAYFLQEMQ